MTARVDELKGQRLSEGRPLLAVFFDIATNRAELKSRRNKEFAQGVENRFEPLIASLVRVLFIKEDKTKSCLEELKRKEWGAWHLQVEKLVAPFLIFFESDFNSFDPALTNWLVIESLHSTKSQRQFEDLANAFTLNANKSPLSNFADYIKTNKGRLKGLPKTFGDGPGLGRIGNSGATSGRPPKVDWQGALVEFRQLYPPAKAKRFIRQTASTIKLSRSDLVSEYLPKFATENLAEQKLDTACRRLKPALDEIERELRAKQSRRNSSS
jgi:hypothetical protein